MPRTHAVNDLSLFVLTDSPDCILVVKAGWNNTWYNLDGIGQLKGQIMASTTLPTAMQTRSATEAREDLTKVVQEVNDLIAAVPQIYDKLGASGLKPATLTAIKMP